MRGSVHLPDPASADALAPLRTMVRIDGRMSVFRNHALKNLADLGRLTFVGGEFSVFIDDNGGLTSLSGVGALREVGGLWLESIPGLRNLSDFSSLQRVNGNVRIQGNAALPQSEIDAFLRRVTVTGTVTVERNGP